MSGCGSLAPGCGWSAPTLAPGPARTLPTMDDDVAQDLREWFEGLALVTETGGPQPVVGRVGACSRTDGRREATTSAPAAASSPSQSQPNLPSRILMSTALDPQHQARGILVGEINTEYLWGLDGLPALTELCVFGFSRVSCCFVRQARRRRSESRHPILLALGRASLSGSTTRAPIWRGYWSIFLKPRFFTPSWTVVLSQSSADVLAPLGNFRRTFLHRHPHVSVGRVVLEPGPDPAEFGAARKAAGRHPAHREAGFREPSNRDER